MRDGTGRPQRVVLLGGRSEIGLATVRALSLPESSTLVLACRDSKTTVPPAGLAGSVQVVEFDALRFDRHAAVLDAVFSAGDVDVLLVAFGVLGEQGRAETDPAHAVDVVTTNLTAAVSLLLGAASRMRVQGHGTLVVFSSLAAVRGRRANFVYGSTKAGLDAFGSGLADALAGSGVRLLLVRPGFVVGRMTAGMAPAPLSSTPERVGAATAAALLAGRPDEVWVPGVLRWVAWLLRLLPRPLWRRMPR